MKNTEGKIQDTYFGASDKAEGQLRSLRLIERILSGMMQPRKQSGSDDTYILSHKVLQVTLIKVTIKVPT